MSPSSRDSLSKNSEHLEMLQTSVLLEPAAAQQRAGAAFGGIRAPISGGARANSSSRLRCNSSHRAIKTKQQTASVRFVMMSLSQQCTDVFIPQRRSFLPLIGSPRCRQHLPRRYASGCGGTEVGCFRSLATSIENRRSDDSFQFADGAAEGSRGSRGLFGSGGLSSRVVLARLGGPEGDSRDTGPTVVFSRVLLPLLF
jgi:hypothetical protein